MIHILTMGHLDRAAIGRRQVIVLRPLDMGTVHRLLHELGGRDDHDRPALEEIPVEIKDGAVACRWQIGSYCNRVAEEFALRLQKATACMLADREHSLVIEPDQLLRVNHGWTRMTADQETGTRKRENHGWTRMTTDQETGTRKRENHG
jgi:hypothetical protein